VVGRDEEIELLLRRWARARAGDGQVFLISGEHGIGKSRMTAVLAERLRAEPHIRLRYFCSPYHQDSTLFPFIDQFGRASGFAPNDPPAAKLEKLEPCSPAQHHRTRTPPRTIQHRTGSSRPSYRWVGVCRAGFGGVGGSVGDCWISGGSTRLHGLCAISVLISRRWLQAASVASQSCASWPRSKHHSCPLEPGPDGVACARKMATPAIVPHMASPSPVSVHDRQSVNTPDERLIARDAELPPDDVAGRS
jgi:hypothetical protein